MQDNECICSHLDYTIGSYKEITSPAYCKSGNELNGTKCAGCSKFFVSKRTSSSNEEIISSTKNRVMACYNVNFCDHAYCNTCYMGKLIENDERQKRRGRSDSRRKRAKK